MKVKADSEHMLYCPYLERNIEEGLCYDVQMISNGYVLPTALPDIEINKAKALKACETCNRRFEV